MRVKLTTPYIVSLVGLALLSIIAVYRADPLLIAFVVVVALLAICALGWEAYAE